MEPEPAAASARPAIVPTSLLAQNSLNRAAVTLSGGPTRVNVGVQTSELGTQEREQLEAHISGELARHGLTIGRIVLSAPIAGERE
jgi:dihydroxyacid dehydratase/phosphogluconate dehydratase